MSAQSNQQQQQPATSQAGSPLTVAYPVQAKDAAALYKMNEEGEGGYFPIGANNFWHGGIHLGKKAPPKGEAPPADEPPSPREDDAPKTPVQTAFTKEDGGAPTASRPDVLIAFGGWTVTPAGAYAWASALKKQCGAFQKVGCVLGVRCTTPADKQAKGWSPAAVNAVFNKQDASTHKTPARTIAERIQALCKASPSGSVYVFAHSSGAFVTDQIFRELEGLGDASLAKKFTLFNVDGAGLSHTKLLKKYYAVSVETPPAQNFRSMKGLGKSGAEYVNSDAAAATKLKTGWGLHHALISTTAQEKAATDPTYLDLEAHPEHVTHDYVDNALGAAGEGSSDAGSQEPVAEGASGVRAIADGTLIAYRINQDPVVMTVGGQSHTFSTSFALIRHESETPKGAKIVFFSLYMHLLPWSAYTDEQKAQPSIFGKPKFLVRGKWYGKGLNLRDAPKRNGKMGNIVTVIPKDVTFTVDDPQAPAWPNAAWRKAKFKDANGDVEGYAYLTDKNAKKRPDGTFQCITEEDAPADSKLGMCVVKNDSSDRVVVRIAPYGSELSFKHPDKVEESLGGQSAWHELEDGNLVQVNGSGQPPSVVVERTGPPETFDKVVNVTQQIRRGDVVGYPGPYLVQPATVHFEIFAGDVGFMDNPKGDKGPVSARKVPAGTTFKKRTKGAKSFEFKEDAGKSAKDLFADAVPESSLSKDQNGKLWQEVTFQSSAGAEAKGWFQIDQQGVEAKSAYDWPDWTRIEDKSGLFSQKGLCDAAELVKGIFEDEDGKLTQAELKHAFADETITRKLHRLACQQHTEWGKDTGALEHLKGPPWNLQKRAYDAVKEKISKLRFWKDVTHEDLPKEDKVWHVHPIGFIENLQAMNSALVRKGDKGLIVEEIQIRLTGFGGYVPTAEFDDETEKSVKMFQKLYMKQASPTGVVDELTMDAIDELATKYPVAVSALKCPCGQCGGFGKGANKGQNNYEHPGIHRSLLWAVRGLSFHMASEAQPRLKVAGFSSGYRCNIDNANKGRRTTNHMGKAVDMLIGNQSGTVPSGADAEKQFGDRKQLCDSARDMIVANMNSQSGWKANRIGLEPTGTWAERQAGTDVSRGHASTWVHMDVREFAAKYREDRFFCKDEAALNGKKLKEIAKTR